MSSYGIKVKEILDKTLTSYIKLFEFVEGDIISKKLLTTDIPINKIVIGNIGLETIRFIDYVAYFTEFSYTILGIKKVIDLLIERYGKSILKELTCISTKTMIEYFDSYIILPVYDVLLFFYYQNNYEECKICYNNYKYVTFEPCNHGCCILCSAEIKKRILKCHICRSFIINRKIKDDI